MTRPPPQQWFRPPTSGERRIAAGLFAAFGLFFVAMFGLSRGWWFRWVLLTLGVWSLLAAASHLREAFRR